MDIKWLLGQEGCGHVYSISMSEHAQLEYNGELTSAPLKEGVASTL